MLWSTFLSWYYPDLLNHFEIALPKKNEVYLGFCITRLISDKVSPLSKKEFPMTKSFATSKSSTLSPSALRSPNRYPPCTPLYPAASLPMCPFQSPHGITISLSGSLQMTVCRQS